MADNTLVGNADDPYTTAPAQYQFAADAHSYAAGDFAITNPETWGDGLTHAGQFVASAAASGLNGFYNTGVAVANWFGADAQENDVADQLGQLDDDLGTYYKANRQSADMAGFIVSSFVPGLGGTKLLNVGQKMLRTAAETGVVGGNTAKVLGLLAPQTERYLALAKADIAATNATYSALSANTLRAVGAGYGQAALEAAAFQIAATATQFKSPVLSEADGWDLAKDLVVGTVVGGAIGGALSHAVGFGKIKAAAKSITPEEQMFSNAADLAGASAAQRIISRNSHIQTMPAAPDAAMLMDSAGPFAGTRTLISSLPEEQQAAYAQTFATKFSRLRTETLNKMELANREDLHTLVTNKDPELGNMLGDMLKGTDADTMLANMHNLVEISRPYIPMAAEKEIAKFNAKQLKDLVDIDSAIQTPGKEVGYVKLSGEGMGDLTFDTPTFSRLPDIFQSTEEVQRAVAGYKFNPKKAWSAVESHDPFEADARYLWASQQKLADGAIIGEHDIPLIDQAVKQRLNNITVQTADGTTYTIDSADDILKHAQVSKGEVALELQKANASGAIPDGLSAQQIADIVNVKRSYLSGEQNINNASHDIFAREAAQAQYVKALRDKGLWTQAKEDNFHHQPTYMKAAYTTAEFHDADGMLLSGMAAVKAQQKVYMEGVHAIIADHVPPDIFWRLPKVSQDMLLTADRGGAGPGVVSFSNGAYGSLASTVEQIGSSTAALQKHYKDLTSAALESHVYKIASNQEAAIGFESINNFIKSTSERYGLNAEGTGIEPLKMLDWKAAVAKGSKEAAPQLQEGAPVFVPISNPDVLAAWTARTNLTGSRTQAFSDLRNAQGLEDIKDPRALRPIRPDPNEYPHFAVVVDPTITGVGHKSMIHAATAGDLEAMIGKVPSKYQVYKKGDLEDFHKAYGDFDSEMTLHENYIDSNLRSAGVASSFFQRTDPTKIADSLIRDHLRSDDIFARELVNAHYEPEFRYLRQQGDQFASAATSRYTGSVRTLEAEATNPYTSYIKTALNISRINEHRYLAGFNNMLDKGVSQIVASISDAFSAARSPAELDKVNNLLNKYGVSSAYRDAATDMLANHTAPKGDLVRFISRANSILSTITLRLDPLNAINNAIGSTVLYGTETKSVLNAMQGTGPEIMGKLNGLLKMPVPSSASLAGQETQTVMTGGKLMQGAIKNFYDKEAVTATGIPLKDFYMKNGWTTRLSDQFHSVLENLTLQGTESVGIMNERIAAAMKGAQALAEKGEKFTGNKWAEEFNRFVAADTMRQLTDIGVQAGRITADEQLAFINSFVNRTQGNIQASQRPLLFQGPVGQAIGLFQSFQFNTMQQLFRHVAEGSKKDAAMMMGLQGTMYGMNGLPAFNFLNTHIVGTASGNPQHRDMYDTTYGIAGKSVGNLLLYGLPSNLLRANLYTRGDINPRQLTVVPTNPLDIPVVNATIKMVDNIMSATSKMANGGNLWQSFLQGIEHNGISRPMAGLAQTLQSLTHGGQVLSTTNKGSLAGANDLMSWATAVRLAGGKPFEEAVANDAAFRFSGYQAATNAATKKLASTVASTGLAGDMADPEQLNKFAAKYAALGHPTQQFNKWMIKTIMDANTPQANKIMENLRNPYSQKMQQLMGGQPMLDGRSARGGNDVQQSAPTSGAGNDMFNDVQS